MQYQLTTAIPGEHETDCIIVGLFHDVQMSPALEYLDKLSGNKIHQVLCQRDINADIEQTLVLHAMPNIAAKRILVVGCGKAEALTVRAYRKIVASAFAALGALNCHDADCYLAELPIPKRDLNWKLQQAIVYSQDVLRTYDTLKTRDKKSVKVESINMAISTSEGHDSAQTAIQHGSAIAEGINLVKTLANLPGNICNPTYLAEQSKQMANKFANLSCHVLNKEDMQKLGMGALLSVAQGSEQSPKLITLEYKGAADKEQKPQVLVGKGITFDSGGLSLKPPKNMIDMKYDMSGAACVLGALQAVAVMQLPINVVAIIAAAENMPGSRASRPGDVVTTMSGLTVEILNTDAEGRLVLCDALCYAKKFNPETVIDLATLTGAVVIALGHPFAGIFSNQQALADSLLQAGKTIDDPLWQFPLTEEYAEALESPVADLANIGPSPAAGSITAASYLSQFCKDYHWAHIDIAGVAWNAQKERLATGRPTTTLIQYLIDQCK